MTSLNSPETESVSERPETLALAVRRARARARATAADRDVAAFLAGRAFLAIRYTAWRALNEPGRTTPEEALERVKFLANLCHNMPGIAIPSTWKPARSSGMTRREEAMRDRPMSWTWNTAGPDGQAWILQKLDEIGYRWTPPPALPQPRRGIPALRFWQRVGLLAGWPVKPPAGRPPLPRSARVVKAIDRDTVCALYDPTGQQPAGSRFGAPWLRAHLAPGVSHFLFPDPAHYEWPDATRPRYPCQALLRMIDGEQVTGHLRLQPETFTALPSTLRRIRQRHLIQMAWATERHVDLWGRDHEPECVPDRCGYTPAEQTTA